MSQSNVIFAFLFAAFIVVITQRGELPVYLGFILATPKAAPASSGTDLSTAVSTAAKVAEIAG